MTALVDNAGEIAEAEMAASRRILEPIRQQFPGLAITEDTVHSRSVPAPLVEASSQAELLVVGARRRAHALGPALGRVTHAVLHHAHCPVAVVPRH